MKNSSPNWGLKIGVMTPATNVTVEEELWSMRVPLVTEATGRIRIDAVDWTSPDGLQKFVEGVNKRLPETASLLKQMKPDVFLLGISSSNLWGGLKGNQEIKNKIYKETGIKMITPVDAIVRAAQVMGFTKIGVVTPYPEIADKKVVEFFSEFGVEVLAQKGLRLTAPSKIGEVSEADLCDAVREVNVRGVEVIIQLGTDLKMARVAAQASNWLRKPTLSVNATTWWHCLREKGIHTQIENWGVLLANH